MSEIMLNGEALRRIRQNLRLSQEDLAVLFGMKQEQISRWEGMEGKIPRARMILHALKNIHREMLGDGQVELLKKYAASNPEVLMMALEQSKACPRSTKVWGDEDTRHYAKKVWGAKT